MDATLTTTLEVLDDDATYCQCCDEAIEGEVMHLDSDLLCRSCWRDAQLEEARDQLEEAESEVESIESEVADRRTEFEEALAALKVEFADDLAEIRGRLTEQKQAARKARRRMVSLEG